MNAEKRVFFDTNILVYAYSSDEIEKKSVVQELLEREQEIVISTQVINEFINVMRRKKAIPTATLQDVLRELVAVFHVSLVHIDTIDSALGISQKYNYSYFDSLMISSALENSCVVLYSEDMHHKQIVGAALTILNPFKTL
jgi:predicted nucleic acid-binding protein